MPDEQPLYERDGARVLKRLDLQPHHRRESRTKHYLGNTPFPPFVSLEIATYNDVGYYLFHVTADGENNDTYHDSVQEAMDQAKFEFDVAEEEWIDVTARS